MTAITPSNIDAVIATVQRDFPRSGIRITGRARTIRRQAELMAQRIQTNRQEFLTTYLHSPHIIQMNQWVLLHPTATHEQVTNEFEQIIREAVSRGAVVSNHLSDSARDISWPIGNSQDLTRIEYRLNELGTSVIREPFAAGGRHWHIDWRINRR